MQGRRGLTSVGVVALILNRARLALLEVLVGNLGKLNHRVVFLSSATKTSFLVRVSRYAPKWGNREDMPEELNSSDAGRVVVVVVSRG